MTISAMYTQPLKMAFSYAMLFACLLAMTSAGNGNGGSDGDLGHICASGMLCNDDGAECNTLSLPEATCECRPGLVQTSAHVCECGENAPAGFPGGSCDGTGMTSCTNDPKATCDTITGICGCETGWSIRQGQCIRDGQTGGRCVTGMCDDKFAACTNGMCMCVPNTMEVNGMCRTASQVGAVCGGTHPPCVAKDTECHLDICNCVDGFRLINGMCVQDGHLGGTCGNQGQCPGDKNSHCDSTSTWTECVCHDGYTAVEGQCVRGKKSLPDGAFGGICIGGTTCPNDKSAECVSTTPPMCMCRADTHPIAGVCMRDGFPGALCTLDNTCPGDKNALCRPGNMCMCDEDFDNIGGACMEVGSAGGRCAQNALCPRDKNARCIMDVCMCVSGATILAGMCRLNGLPGGFCDGRFKDECSRDKNAVCVDGMCMCREGTSKLHGAMCIQVERLGGQCSGVNGTWCKGDRNAYCHEGMCMCREGSTPSGGWCVRDGYPGAACVNGQCTGLSSCDSVKGMCVCTGVTYVAVGGRCHNIHRTG